MRVFSSCTHMSAAAALGPRSLSMCATSPGSTQHTRSESRPAAGASSMAPRKSSGSAVTSST
eukprot:1574911-Rhodomonas_salina.1